MNNNILILLQPGKYGVYTDVGYYQTQGWLNQQFMANGGITLNPTTTNNTNNNTPTASTTTTTTNANTTTTATTKTNNTNTTTTTTYTYTTTTNANTTTEASSSSFKCGLKKTGTRIVGGSATEVSYSL